MARVSGPDDTQLKDWELRIEQATIRALDQVVNRIIEIMMPGIVSESEES